MEFEAVRARDTIIEPLPELTRDEALRIKYRVLKEWPDLSRGLKTIIADRIVDLTRRLKAAEQKQRKAQVRRDEEAMQEARAEIVGLKLALIDPVTSQIDGQIGIEREQKRTQRVVEKLANL